MSSIYKYTPSEIVLSSFPYRRFTIVVEAAKRIFTNEKLDRQLAGQSSSTPFMNI